MSRDDGTAHPSVGELRQGKRNLFLLLFCLFRQTIEKSSVNNRIIALWFSLAERKNPLESFEKFISSPPIAAGIFFAQKLGKKTCDPSGSRFIQRSSASYFL